jgi:anti-sigma28 factor (negative regulator of flagellin synthesis)
MAAENNNAGKQVSVERLEALIEEALTEGGEFSTKRSPTLLKLGWLAERLRKAERIKAQVEAGTYHVDSADVAKAILNLD